METSASLLDRLRRQPDESGWQQLVDLYTPLIHGWLRQFSVWQNDIDDVAQEVLTVVTRKLPLFDRQRSGSFRRWLRSITVNCLREWWRKQRQQPLATGDSNFLQTLDQLEDPHSVWSQRWDREHQQHVTACLLEQIKPRFEETTWQAFKKVALDGLSATEVARELNMTTNAVFIAKSRVMTLLRQEGDGLLD